MGRSDRGEVTARDEGFASLAVVRGALGGGEGFGGCPRPAHSGRRVFASVPPCYYNCTVSGEKGAGAPPFLHLTFSFAFDMLKWSIKFGAVKTL